MKSDRSVTAQASKLLTLIVFLGITVLLTWEYRVTRASQQSMAGRVAHQNELAADEGDGIQIRLTQTAPGCPQNARPSLPGFLGGGVH